MKDFWNTASTTTLYDNWFGGIARGMFYEGGLYDSAPLKKFIKSQFAGTTLSRAINVGIADILSGDFLSFTEANMTTGNNLVDVLYASFAFAGFFPPVEAFGS